MQGYYKKNLTDQFIDDLYDLRKIDFPDTIYQQVKSCLLDYLGVTFAGAQLMKSKGNRLIELLDSGGDNSAIGFDKNCSLQTSVLVNGLSSHIAELDDGVISGSVHPGAPLFSALLPVSKKEKVSSKDLITGIIIGYETIVRLANAIQPSHKNNGYHATATCGAIGTAIGLSVMLRMSKKQMKDAFSSAVVSASGSLKVIEGTSELKPYNVGSAALSGLTANLMARAGFEGPNDVLTGQNGFFSMMSDKFNQSFLFKDNNEPLAIERIYFKPYAACRYCHPAIDATLHIRDQSLCSLEDIEEVHVNTYQLAVTNHDHTIVKNVSSAKMSIPYSVAVALKLGKAGMEEYSPKYINDPEITSLMKKIRTYSDAEFTSAFPKKSIASVEVKGVKSKSLYEKVEYPKGEPENPLTEDELKGKFWVLMEYAGRNNKQAKGIIDAVFNLENKLQDLYLVL